MSQAFFDERAYETMAAMIYEEWGFENQYESQNNTHPGTQPGTKAGTQSVPISIGNEPMFMDEFACQIEGQSKRTRAYTNLGDVVL
jgi:hypothetical protein